MQQYTNLMDTFTQLTVQALKMMTMSSTDTITGKTTCTTTTLPQSTETYSEEAVGSTAKVAKVLR